MAKDYARAFYDSPAWRRTREAYLQSKHYICEDCGGAASVVHHITYIKPWNVNNPEITLNWDNLKAVCEKCHAQEHAQDLKKRGGEARRNGVAFDEEGNLIKQANVFLICGSPASGKTTYVAEHKGECDLVVDLDYICAALAGEAGNVHTDRKPVLSVALEVRELLYQIIAERRGKWERAFVVTTIADAREMKAVADELRAEVIIMQATLPECLQRIKDDPSRKNRTLYERLAKEWFEKYNKSLECGAIPPLRNAKGRESTGGGKPFFSPLRARV